MRPETDYGIVLRELVGRVERGDLVVSMARTLERDREIVGYDGDGMGRAPRTATYESLVHFDSASCGVPSDPEALSYVRRLRDGLIRYVVDRTERSSTVRGTMRDTFTIRDMGALPEGRTGMFADALRTGLAAAAARASEAAEAPAPTPRGPSPSDDTNRMAELDLGDLPKED